MTASEIVEQAELLGATLTLVADGRVQFRGPAAAAEIVAPLVRAHKAEIVDLLLQRQHRVGVNPKATDAVIHAARLLREGKWAQTEPVCAFHCGQPGEACWRCGAPLIEHYTDNNG